MADENLLAELLLVAVASEAYKAATGDPAPAVLLALAPTGDPAPAVLLEESPAGRLASFLSNPQMLRLKVAASAMAMQARAALLALLRPDTADALSLLAERAIREDEGRTEPERHEVRALAAELGARLPELARCLELDSPGAWPSEKVEWHGTERKWSLTVSRKLASRDGMLRADADGADFLEAIGPTGAAYAAAVREGARARWQDYEGTQLTFAGTLLPSDPWHLWFDPSLTPTTVRFASILAEVLWRDVVKKILATPPALALPVTDNIFALYLSPGRTVEKRDNRLALVGPDGEKVADVVLVGPDGEKVADVVLARSDTLEAIRRGSDRLRQLTGQRTLRFLVEEAHRLAMTHNPCPDVRVDGGLEGFAERLGERGHSARERVLDVLRAGAAFAYQWPGGEIRGLWTFGMGRKASPKARAELVISTAACLRPFYVHHIQQADKLLVPLLPLPPFVGRELDYAAQGVFQFLLCAAMVQHRREMADRGGALLKPTELDRLAGRAGLPPSLLARVMDRWLCDGDDGPAMLEKVARDVYMLADRDPYKRAREWLLKTAQMTDRRSSAASKYHKLGRKMRDGEGKGGKTRK
jgi:hypothetical protein